MVRKIAALALVVLVAAPAQAQFAVIDNANLAQAILIVQRTQRHLRGTARAVPHHPTDGAAPGPDGPVTERRRSRSRATTSGDGHSPAHGSPASTSVTRRARAIWPLPCRC